MNFSFTIFYTFLSFFFATQVYSQNLSTCNTNTISNAICDSSKVLIYTPGSNIATSAPPSTSLSIGQLQITYSVTLDASNVSGFSYDSSKWGVYFGTPASLTYYNGAQTLPSGVTISIDASKVSTSGQISAGTVIITIDFTNANPNNKLTNDITSLISSTASLQIQPLYASSSNITNSALAFYWKADTGAMLYGPTISVQAQDSAFVVNLNPPSSLNAATPSPSTGTATALTSTTNSLTGYVIVYWLDTDANGNSTGCRANPTNWQFNMNPVAFASAPSTNPTTCSYTQYQSSFKTGGISNALGCPSSFLTNVLQFDSTISSVSLTSDSIAIPYTPGISNPANIPSDSYGTPSGCYNVVYIPSSQSSWSKGNINDGDIYGVVAWALNSSYPTPNYSLAHSNISYITGVNIPLASTDKDPNLPKTISDCFIVTAASGDTYSQSVFYWRILRDEYLTPLGITPFYYRHAKVWANWIDNHPKFKPILNTVFKYSGKTLYYLSGAIKKSSKTFKNIFFEIKKAWNQEANAQDLSSNNASEKYNLYEQPKYDFFLTAGVLFPTDDKKYYDKYYSSQMSFLVESGANYIFWLNNLGFSVGLLGRYLSNSSQESITVLGTQQQYTLNFYSLTSEALIGIRYRDPCWSYLQPGIFAGAGVTRFREEANTGSSNNTIGVTQYSPIYEIGANLDINLVPLFSPSQGEIGFFLRDISLRLSASYNKNPTRALSSTGIFLQSGFVFLLN